MQLSCIWLVKCTVKENFKKDTKTSDFNLIWYDDTDHVIQTKTKLDTKTSGKYFELDILYIK